jgi:hypothetical protein
MDEIFFVLFVKIETAPRRLPKSPTYPRKDVTPHSNHHSKERLYTRFV